MRKFKVISVTTLLTACFCWACSFHNFEEDVKVDLCDPNDRTTVSFADTVFPIIQRVCADTANGSCHFTGGAPPIYYTDYSQVKTVVDNGKLQARLFDHVPSPMPPIYSAGHSVISDCEKTLIHRWMEQGALNN